VEKPWMTLGISREQDAAIAMQMVPHRNNRAPQKVEPPVIGGRVPPHDLDAEAAVLSAILLDRDALDRVLEFLKPEQFYSEANGRIFEAATELAEASTPVDVVSVASWLRDRESPRADRRAVVPGAAHRRDAGRGPRRRHAR
jgi:replicative DNA helicase